MEFLEKTKKALGSHAKDFSKVHEGSNIGHFKRGGMIEEMIKEKDKSMDGFPDRTSNKPGVSLMIAIGKAQKANKHKKNRRERHFAGESVGMGGRNNEAQAQAERIQMNQQANNQEPTQLKRGGCLKKKM